MVIMARRWFVAFALCFCVLQLGCGLTPKKHRDLRQPKIEEYNLPPSNEQLTEGPFYPEQKRQFGTQIKDQQKGLPRNAGGGLGGGGVPGGGGGGGPGGSGQPGN